MNEYNFYGWQTADIRSAQGLTPRECYALLMQIWCAETCAPRMRAQWSEDNKTKGQCSITAFLMQDLFGGEVYGIPLGDGNYHCFNRVGTVRQQGSELCGRCSAEPRRAFCQRGKAAAVRASAACAARADRNTITGLRRAVRYV